MSSVPLIALKSLRYAGVAYVVGESFEARDAADATVLRMTGLAKDAPAPVEPDPAPSRAYETKDLTTEPETAEPSSHIEEGSPATPRRRYRRRNLTAD